MSLPLNPPAIILVRPQLGMNIGAVARAMLNFGLTELRLVQPRDGWPNPDAGPSAAGADKALIEAVSVFDQFTGEKAEAQMGAGKKSIALTVRLQPVDKTLTEAEIEAVSAKIIEKVAKATGGALRG